MKKQIFLALLALSMPLSMCACSVDKPDDVNMQARQITFSENVSASQMLTEAKSAVVGISVSTSGGYAIGSGVAISDGALILTNQHVIDSGGAVTLYYADKTIGSGKVIWQDEALDMAVIKSSKALPYLDVNFDSVEVGENVYALGTPLTLEFKHTITHGIVSATNRTLEVESSSGGTIYMQSLIQHDAPINPGNSGGPLINERGQVIGINTLKASEGEGLGFAIPIEVGKQIVDKLKADSNYKSPFLGIFAFDSDLAMAHGREISTQGIYVVSSTGPAQKAGLKKGDVITSIGGKEILSMLDMRKQILSLKRGEAVMIKFMRDGEMMEALATLS